MMMIIMLVMEEEFLLINNTGLSHTGYLIASFYGKLMPDQVYSSNALVELVKDGAPSIAASRSISYDTVSSPSTSEACGGSSLNTFISLCHASVSDCPMSCKSAWVTLAFLISVRGLCSKFSNFYDNICAQD
jgi:hypothetical protein